MRIAKIHFLILAVWFNFIPSARAEYVVIPQGSVVRGHLWIGDGIAGVFSNRGYLANRFRMGGEIHMGQEYQYILGWTFYDRISSAESTSAVGSISRRAGDLSFGYFTSPDKLWIMYSLHIEDISGNSVIGGVTVFGQQISVGRRFYTNGSFNLAVEAAYLFVPSYTASTYNYTTSTAGSVPFPLANIWSLNLRIGVDIGGH